MNSEQKRHLQRQPFLGAARRGFSCVAATFASQMLNNPTGISQIHLVFLAPRQKPVLSCPETDLTELRLDQWLLNSFARFPFPQAELNVALERMQISPNQKAL